jgi:hypothetical protein
MTQKELFKWLLANGKKLGCLTSQDTRALMASVAIAPLISWDGAPPQLFDAYRAVVSEMQPCSVPLAFESIAAVLDWSHREMIFRRSGLEINFSFSKHEC